MPISHYLFYFIGIMPVSGRLTEDDYYNYNVGKIVGACL
jgi:hypothetical protein